MANGGGICTDPPAQSMHIFLLIVHTWKCTSSCREDALTRAKLAACRKPLSCRRMQTRSAALLEGVHTRTRLLGRKWYSWRWKEAYQTKSFDTFIRLINTLCYWSNSCGQKYKNLKVMNSYLDTNNKGILQNWLVGRCTFNEYNPRWKRRCSIVALYL